MESISNVFAPRHQGRSAGELLHLGALKANIGHGEASAGIASLIKVLLMLKRHVIPPHIGIKGVVNHTFPDDLEQRGIRIPFKETPWRRPAEGKRIAYLNNFGASGGNTGMLLEDAPTRISGRPDRRTCFVISVTAKSASSLKRNIQDLIIYLDRKPKESLASLSYTLAARRMHHHFRISFAASSIDDVRENLVLSLDKAVRPLSTKPQELCFLFTGQGSQYPALGKTLFEDSKQFRTDILDFDRIGRNQGFPSFLPLIDGTISEIDSLPPVIVQLGLSCVQMALARLWKSWGVVPSAVLGHSLGQYAALNVAGVISASDTIFLVGRRAELLGEKCTVGTHAMLAVGTSVRAVHELLKDEALEVACVNGPQETVISGPTNQIISYSKTIQEAGVRCIILPTAYAFHSSQVSSIMDCLRTVAEPLNFHDPKIPVISPLLQAVVSRGGVFGPRFLARHAREPVNFLGALAAAKEDGIITQSTVFLELGSTPVVSAFIKSALGKQTVAVSSLRKNEDPWKSIANALSTLHQYGAKITWNEIYHDYQSSYEVLSLPRYSFDLKNYWIDYTNKWQLTKGEMTKATANSKKPRNKPTTASIQKIIKENYGEKTVTLEAESDFMHPDLHEAVCGHLINGSALTPSVCTSQTLITNTDMIAGSILRHGAHIGRPALSKDSRESRRRYRYGHWSSRNYQTFNREESRRDDATQGKDHSHSREAHQISQSQVH